MPDQPLRVVTYLAPALPLAYFEAITDHLAETLRQPLLLETRFDRSGPAPGEDGFDVAFVCWPSYMALRPALEALAWPVFSDPRAAGRPVYFADVVVRADDNVDLQHATWAVNDPASLSGYHCVVERFGPNVNLTWSGSHWASMDLVVAGEADAAAIDSNVLVLRLREQPNLAERLRVDDSWGPFPVQPVVARADLGRQMLERLTAALLAMRDGLAVAGVTRFTSAPPVGLRPTPIAARRASARSVGLQLAALTSDLKDATPPE